MATSNEIADLFSSDAFALENLVAAINDVDHLPGRAGQLVFADKAVTKPISTTSIAIERVGESLELVQTAPRGAPAQKIVADRRTLQDFKVPHIPVGDTILADSVLGVRQFGTNNVPLTVETKINEVLAKLARRLDYTLEHHRLGALKGQILDADGTVLTDLYESFGYLSDLGVAQPQTFDFDLDSLATDSGDVRVKCQAVARYMRRNAKTVLSQDALVWAVEIEAQTNPLPLCVQPATLCRAVTGSST